MIPFNSNMSKAENGDRKRQLGLVVSFPLPQLLGLKIHFRTRWWLGHKVSLNQANIRGDGSYSNPRKYLKSKDPVVSSEMAF